MMQKLNEIPDKNPFKVPENYFEEVNRKIISTTSGYNQEIRKIGFYNRFRPYFLIAAQNPNLDKLNAYKIGFFTKRLNLTSQEAEKFWPVYNEYQKQKNLVQQEKFTLIRNLKRCYLRQK